MRIGVGWEFTWCMIWMSKKLHGFIQRTPTADEHTLEDWWYGGHITQIQMPISKAAVSAESSTFSTKNHLFRLNFLELSFLTLPISYWLVQSHSGIPKYTYFQGTEMNTTSIIFDDQFCHHFPNMSSHWSARLNLPNQRRQILRYVNISSSSVANMKHIHFNINRAWWPKEEKNHRQSSLWVNAGFRGDHIAANIKRKVNAVLNKTCLAARF